MRDLAAHHHNPVVSFQGYLISHWWTIILPTNEKSDSIKRKPLDCGERQGRAAVSRP